MSGEHYNVVPLACTWKVCSLVRSGELLFGLVSVAGKANSSFHVLQSARIDEPEAERHFATSAAEERPKILVDAVPKKTKVATEFWIHVF